MHNLYTRGILFIIIIIGINGLYAQVNFTEETIDDQVSIGYGLAIGDVNGDQKPDILMADKKAYVWYRNPDWKRFVMIENLTERDNVCLAAKDINGDGMVEVAVGAQWNPGETADATKSGSVHILVRPDDPTQKWEAIQLPHVPTIHRMQWVEMRPGVFVLMVLPLHGLGNEKGEGEPVEMLVHTAPVQMRGSWDYISFSTGMHLTHNFTVVENPNLGMAGLYVAGKEGIKGILTHIDALNAMYEGPFPTENWTIEGGGFGEVSLGKGRNGRRFIAGIQPMHGNKLLTKYLDLDLKPTLICNDLEQGHALACADFLGMDQDQIVVGWRNPNKEGKVGIRMYVPGMADTWAMYPIDDNGMACEDLKVEDLDGDGDLDIIAAGRATKNLKIYWNGKN